jgi:peptidoglycan/xylan/chitin deacetylase (PgdA/CDA1 family)
MHYTTKQFTLILFLLIGIKQFALGRSQFENTKMTNPNVNLSNFLNSINICKWKEGANTCLNISFDDNCKSQMQISRIFDQYGYKASFFIISSILNKWYCMKTDSVRDICKRGHEIGNHTYSHTLQFQTEPDSSKIDFEVRTAKEMIEDSFKIKCVSFADPYHQNSSLSRRIVFRYNLFSRDYSIYTTYQRLDIDSTLRINAVMSYFKKGIQSGNMLIMCGHGIDNDGYSPITKSLLVQILDSAKKYVNAGKIWITTLKEGEQYDNLFHEIILEKEVHGDTLILNFSNYNKEKCQDVAASYISVEIPYSLTKDITVLSDSVELKTLSDRCVLTADLKRDTTLVVLIKGLVNLTNFKSANPMIIYPNPVSNTLYLSTKDQISSLDIYDLNGVLLINKTGNVSQIDVSQLKNGMYIIKTQIVSNNSIVTCTNKFYVKMR